MEKHAEDARRKAMVIDIDMLVPKDHLLRKIEKVMDYDWLYERLNPLYNDKVGRPGTDPVVLIKMVLIQHLFGIPSLRHTTTDRNGKRTYRSTPSVCMNCPCREKCGANGKGQKLIQRHIWQEYLDVVEGIRKTDLGKSIYEKRKETIERVFADAKEKHSMRYTHMRGLTRVTQWVRLKFAAMNLKKLANWAWKRLCLQAFGKYFWIFEAADGCCAA